MTIFHTKVVCTIASSFMGGTTWKYHLRKDIGYILVEPEMAVQTCDASKNVKCKLLTPKMEVFEQKSGQSKNKTVD